jgi:hypothetical protein
MESAKKFIVDAVREISRSLNGLDRTEWILIMIGVLICGMFVLRGLGSRTSC